MKAFGAKAKGPLSIQQAFGNFGVIYYLIDAEFQRID